MSKAASPMLLVVALASLLAGCASSRPADDAELTYFVLSEDNGSVPPEHQWSGRYEITGNTYTVTRTDGGDLPTTRAGTVTDEQLAAIATAIRNSGLEPYSSNVPVCTGGGSTKLTMEFSDGWSLTGKMLTLEFDGSGRCPADYTLKGDARAIVETVHALLGDRQSGG